MANTIPPPPPGFQLVQQGGGVPPPPPGFEMVQPERVITEPTVTVKAPDRLPGVLGTINDFGNDLGDAVAHHLGNAAVGVGQLIAHGVADRALANEPRGGAEPNTGFLSRARNLARKEAGAIRSAVGGIDQYAAEREADYQAQVPDSAGSYIGAGIGELLPWAVGLGEVRALGMAPKVTSRLGRLGMLATEGAAMGASQPVTGGDYNTEKGLQSAVGAVASPLAYGVAGGASRLAALTRRPAVDPLDRAALDILSLEAENPAALSKAAPSQVPGVQRTLAEETLDPGIARLERNLRSTNKQFDALDRSNNAARVGALEKIAGSDAGYANAEATREKVTGQFRDKAFREGGRFDASRTQQSLVQRGIGNQVDSSKGPLEAQIQAIANSNKGRPSVISTMATVSKAVQDAGDSVAGLYNVRKYIGDLLSGKAGADTSAAQSATRELMSVRDAIDKELTQRAPTFSRYLIAYQDFSKPINRMDVGRELMDRSSGGATRDAVTGQQVLTPAQFSKKARDLDAVAKKATGFAKAKATDILSSTDIASIKAIQDDLERQFFRATAGSGGNSHTFEREQLQDRLKRGVGRETLRHIPIVGRYAGDFLDILDKSRNDRIQERLAYLVANPAEARRVLSSLPPAGRRIVNNALLRLGAPVSRISTTPAGQPSSGQ